MTWIIQYHEAARAEALQLPHDMQARLDRLLGLIAAHGLHKLPSKTVKHIDGDLWELRIKGKDGIARAFYVTLVGQRVVIVRVFVKKTQRTPPREIRLAQQRATEV